MKKQDRNLQLVWAAVEAVRLVIRAIRPVPKVRLIRVSDLPYNAGWHRA